MLTVGQEAPNFSLKTQDGKSVRLHDFQGKQRVLLVFYPGDQTPGCTKQLCDIRDNYAALTQYDVVPFGVNPGDAESHQAFINAQNYQFDLLVDENMNVAKAYEAVKAEGSGIQRTVYVVGKDGTIIFAKRGAPPTTEIVEAIKTADDEVVA
jgi:peroxiredoxin Q/BCP